MADHNESLSTTEHSFSQEFINTTDAGEEFLYPEPPMYSLDDPNASESNRRNWTTDEDDVEQEGFDHNGTKEVEYEENGATRSRLFRDHTKTYDDSNSCADRRHERAQTRQFSGHSFVKDHLRATAATSGRTYSAQTHPAQPHQSQPYPAQPHHAKPPQATPHSAKAYPPRPYHENPHPLKPYSSQPAQPPNLDRAQIHRYIEASPAAYQDQVFSMTRAEPPAPSEPTFDIVYIPRKWPRRPEYLRSYISFSVIVCFFCNLPLGLIAMCLSLQAKTLWLKGDHRRAKSYSRAALILNIVSVILTILIFVFIFRTF